MAKYRFLLYTPDRLEKLPGQEHAYKIPFLEVEALTPEEAWKTIEPQIQSPTRLFCWYEVSK